MVSYVCEGGCISVGIEDVDLALDRDLEVLELKYGFEKILQKVMRRARGKYVSAFAFGNY